MTDIVTSMDLHDLYDPRTNRQRRLYATNRQWSICWSLGVVYFALGSLKSQSLIIILYIDIRSRDEAFTMHSTSDFTIRRCPPFHECPIIRTTICVIRCAWSLFRPIHVPLNRLMVGLSERRVTDRKDFLRFRRLFLLTHRDHGLMAERRRRGGEEEREMENAETRAKFHWGSEMSHDDELRFMRAPLRE